MKFKYIIIIIFLMLAGTAGADVGFSINCYNSYDSVSANMEGDNLNYKSYTTLKPDTISYSNGGSSAKPECSYSFSMTLNEDYVECGTDTDNGVFKWSAKVVADQGDDSKEVFKLSAGNIAKNGILNTYYGNSDLKVEESLVLKNALYSNNIKVDSETVTSEGTGSTISVQKSPQEESEEPVSDIEDQDDFSKLPSSHEPPSWWPPDEDESPDNEDDEQIDKNPDDSEDSGSDADDDSGEPEPSEPETEPSSFIHVVSTTAKDGMNGNMEMEISGDTKSAWNNGVISSESGYSFGMSVEGKSSSPLDEMHMVGKAPNVQQSLPAGDVVIDVNYVTEETEEQGLEYVDEELKEFEEEYSDSSLALWYLLNQRCYVNPIEDEYDPNGIKSGEYYRMRMMLEINHPKEV